MVASARRYDPVVDILVRELYDPGASMAETCRRVADRVQELGFTRPSLVHLRTLVRDERDRRAAEDRRADALAEVGREIVKASFTARVPNARWLRERFERATEPRRT